MWSWKKSKGVLQCCGMPLLALMIQCPLGDISLWCLTSKEWGRGWRGLTCAGAHKKATEEEPVTLERSIWPPQPSIGELGKSSAKCLH